LNNGTGNPAGGKTFGRRFWVREPGGNILPANGPPRKRKVLNGRVLAGKILTKYWKNRAKTACVGEASATRFYGSRGDAFDGNDLAGQGFSHGKGMKPTQMWQSGIRQWW
jgi:hypothetical protein